MSSRPSAKGINAQVQNADLQMWLLTVNCVLQVSFVGLTEEAAREQAEKDGYKDKIAVTKTSFKANSKVVPMSLKLRV